MIYENAESVSSESTEDPGDDSLLATPTTSNVHPGRKSLLYLFTFLFFWQTAFKVSTAAIQSILKFLKFFLCSLGIAYNQDHLKSASTAIPLTKRTLCKILGLTEYQKYQKGVVCSKCSSVYNLDFCLSQRANGTFEVKKCPYVKWPNHPHESQRGACSGHLLSMCRLKGKSGMRTVYRPIKIYPYCSLAKSLRRLASQPGFLKCCELWRTRPDFRTHGYVCDVYDGDVWKSFVESGFLQAPLNFLLTMNVDWFSPFARSRYSVGAIYLTIQNLPRSIRYHPENIILVGIIPGPGEPKHTINNFLAPLVHELQEAWTSGIAVTTPSGVETFVRVALSCVACDIPATRKVCGLLGIRATLGCNKCLKRFVQVRDATGQWTDFSGYERSTWTLRNDAEFKTKCKTVFTKENCKTQTDKTAWEAKLGGRYSVLMDLPYFKPIQYSVIDPMHNLFLGTGKHMLQVWLESDILTKKSLAVLGKRMHSFVIPDGIGRLPTNIEGAFIGFTADQWKNWIIIFSPILLRGLIGNEHWRCWMLFVTACSIFTSRILRLTYAKEADDRILSFCKSYLHLYSKKSCTMNMHLHLHLLQCILDYGSTSGFWLYAFERYNGLLGSFHTNSKSVESQLLKTFLERQSLTITSNIFDNPDFVSTLPSSLQQRYQNICNNDFEPQQSNIISVLEAPSGPLQISLDTYKAFAIQLTSISPYQEKFLGTEEHRTLTEVLHMIFGTEISFPRAYLQFGRLTIGDDLLGSCLPRSNRSSSLIIANWLLDNSSTTQKVIGEIQHFLKIPITFHPPLQEPTVAHVHTNNLEVTIAFVHWFRHHPTYRDWYGSSFTVCESVLPKIVNQYSYLPVHRVLGRCAHITMEVDFEGVKEEVLVASHLPIRLTY